MAAVIENWDDFAHSTRGLLIGCAVMFMLVVAGMFLTGEWTAYAHDIAWGVKFAPGPQAGCGIEIPTAKGRQFNMPPLYCEGSGPLSGFAPAWLYGEYHG